MKCRTRDGSAEAAQRSANFTTRMTWPACNELHSCDTVTICRTQIGSCNCLPHMHLLLQVYEKYLYQ